MMFRVVPYEMPISTIKSRWLLKMIDSIVDRLIPHCFMRK